MIYQKWMQLSLKILFYDKFKQISMPYDTQKYRGVDYGLRVLTASIFAQGLTLALTYPYDTWHTRMSADMGTNAKTRLYVNCF